MEKVKITLEGHHELMRKLKKLDERTRKKILKKVARESLKPMVDSYKRNIKDADEVFKVYRNGKIYAEIMPGQLRRSIGIGFPKYLNKGNDFGASVGPRRSGRFKDPEKGGWYGGFINFGWLQVGGGKDYKGPNVGYAERAKGAAKTKVQLKFVRNFKSVTEREIKKLKFGQRFGLR